MPLTFEEMADAGLKDLPPSKKSNSQVLARILILATTCALCTITAYQRVAQAQKEKPMAAQILLAEVDDLENVLPHVEDDATEFKEALPFLKPIANAPEYRETAVGQKVDALVSAEGPKSSPHARLSDSTIEEMEIDAPRIVEALKTKNASELNTLDSLAEVGLHQEMPASASDLPQDIVIQSFQISNDWGGIVLVPEDHILAKAYNSNVRLLRIEAHPIDGDYIRVWTRIENRTETLIETEVGCEFRGSNNRLESPSFAHVSLPPRGVIDAYFVSRNPEVHSYTVLVKR